MSGESKAMYDTAAPVNRPLKINRVVVHLSVWYLRKTFSGAGTELVVSWGCVSIVKTPNGQ